MVVKMTGYTVTIYTVFTEKNGSEVIHNSWLETHGQSHIC